MVLPQKLYLYKFVYLFKYLLKACAVPCIVPGARDIEVIKISKRSCPQEVLHSTGGKLAINIDKIMSDSARCYGENKTGLPRVGW